ncbi:sigma-54-dependent transcriptional regulator [Pelomicrobium sp. G1]|uniref:sigma-54-dependent transcriptional regulator n=2 Tax=unclassified Pelomicrobium TaxID=2815318 RepID=UPI003F7780BB
MRMSPPNRRQPATGVIGVPGQPDGKPVLLVVDDDNLITDTLAFVLGRDFEVHVAETRPHAISLVRQLDPPPDLALVDLGLPPIPHQPDEGFRLISELLAHSEQMKILVLSGQNDEANARHARALGAVDFIAKPCEPEDIKAHLMAALNARARELKREEETLPGEYGIIGSSEPIQKMREQIRQYARAPFPVLIEGESGSGKEMVAAALHKLSANPSAPYLALNCAAISPNLVEPTLFGYAKGSFTGATGAKSGYFEDASGGTLFLDEIGELPLDLQPKLLRVLENGEFQRVGETQTRKSSARVIAATNRDLRQEVRSGRFRADLYHRLSVFTIQVPPLRELDGDKLLLLEHFRRFYSDQGDAQPFELAPDALELWKRYAFPGNVRELRNIVIRLVTKYAGRQVDARQLEAELDVNLPAASPDEAMLQRDPEALLALATRQLQREREFSLDQTLKLWEQSYIRAALQLTHGNVSQAAKLLGINRTTLYSRMEARGESSDKNA